MVLMSELRRNLSREMKTIHKNQKEILGRQSRINEM